MSKKTIFGTVLIILVVFFSLQNTQQVPLKFFWAECNGSLSLFLILAVLVGVIIGSQFTFTLRKNNKEVKSTDMNDKEITQK